MRRITTIQKLYIKIDKYNVVIFINHNLNRISCLENWKYTLSINKYLLAFLKIF